jgi:hypothetical protein
MLGTTKSCATNRGGAPKAGAKVRAGPNVRHAKIIDTVSTDLFGQLFMGENITPEQWQLIIDVRRLAFFARRSQGICVRLQSHSKYWGMPLVCSDDGYENGRTERKWRLFLFYLKPFLEHGWLDRQLLELLLFGGGVLFADDIKDVLLLKAEVDYSEPEPEKRARSDLARLGFSMDVVHHALCVIEYVYEKVCRSR